MYKYEKCFNDDGKEKKVLYVADILKGDSKQEFDALDMVVGYMHYYDAVIFKYTDGSSQRVDNKK